MLYFSSKIIAIEEQHVAKGGKDVKMATIMVADITISCWILKVLIKLVDMENLKDVAISHHISNSIPWDEVSSKLHSQIMPNMVRGKPFT